MFQGKSFADDFIRQYLRAGLGSMSKRDVEILVYHLLRQNGYFNSQSLYDQSIQLKISESKLRNLIYEVELRYEHRGPAYINKGILMLIQKAYFKSNDDGFIMFAVEDKYLQSALNARLKKLGAFSDTSFNKEIISVPVDAFILLVEDCYGQEKTEEVRRKCLMELKEKNIQIKDSKENVLSEEDLTFGRLLKICLKSAFKLGSDSFAKSFGEALGKTLGNLPKYSIFKSISEGLIDITQLIALIN